MGTPVSTQCPVWTNQRRVMLHQEEQSRTLQAGLMFRVEQTLTGLLLRSTEEGCTCTCTGMLRQLSCGCVGGRKRQPESSMFGKDDSSLSKLHPHPSSSALPPPPHQQELIGFIVFCAKGSSRGHICDPDLHSAFPWR